MTAEVILADNLQDLPGLRHGFFTKDWGNGGFSGEVDPQQVIHMRRQVALYLGTAPERIVSCRQVHSPDVVEVTEPWSVTDRPRADAMVTKVAGTALAVLTADCAPLLFADLRARVVGVAHAGWRGALSGVIENTVIAMEKLGATRSSIHAAIGPCIGPHSYEVGPEFPAPFLAENPDHQRFFRLAVRPDHYMFDLPGYVATKLRGLKIASVEPSPADTCADSQRFFSYRRSFLQGKQRAGNLISVIVLSE